MRSLRTNVAAAAILLPLCGPAWAAEETPVGKGLSEANLERLVLDDLEDVADWYNGSPDETTLSRSDKHPQRGRYSLRFANRVDHTKGEAKYPIGWPRTGKDFGKAVPTDWSAYDFFECWVRAETSRNALPATPLGLSFSGAGPQKTGFPLRQVQKDAWVKVVIPIADLAGAADIRRLQFHISESDYRHGDQVDFYIAGVALARYTDPVVAEMSLRRKLVYASDAAVTATARLSGSRDMGNVTAELEIGRGAEPLARAAVPAARSVEISVSAGPSLEPGTYWARLSLRDREGRLVDRRQAAFRVIEGPF